MGLLSRPTAPLSASLALVLLASGCFSELKGDSCINDLECFPNETCLVGTCVERAVEVADVGMDVEEGDVGEDVEPDTGSGLRGEARLQGCVYDRETGAGITVARVYTIPDSGSAVTGQDGCYTIVIPRIERFDNFFELKVEHFSYVLNDRVTVTVSSNITNVGDILMCKANGCDTCSALAGVPGEACMTQEGCAGFWECAPDKESVVCGDLVCE